MTEWEEECACRAAVSRAFAELRKRRVGEEAAFESAVTVFRFHHPDLPVLEAQETVDRWLAS